MWTAWYDRLDRHGRRAFWTTAGGFAVDSMDVQLYAFALPVLLELWRLSPGQAGLLSTVTLVSSAAGGLLVGLLADRLGRLRMLKATILWLAASTCLCGLAMNVHQLMAARVLQGLGFGGEWAAGAVFIAEVASPADRGRVVGTVQSAWAVGWGLAATVFASATAFLPPNTAWRATFFAGLLPAALVFRSRLNLSEPNTFLSATRPSDWGTILRRPMIGSTARGSLLAAGMHGGYWAIATWWPVMLHRERHLSTAAATGHFAAIIIGSFAGYLTGAWLGDRAGRRVMLATFSIGAMLMVLMCTMLPLPDLALLALSVPLGFFALGMFSAIGPVLSELFPTHARGAGLGFCYNFGRALAGATPLLVGGSIGRIGISYAIGLFSACAFGIVLVATLSLPETRGHDLANSDLLVA